MKRWRVDQRGEVCQRVRSWRGENWKHLRRSPRGWCYVYFVASRDRIKIGRATDPSQRFSGLQVAHAEALSLVLTIPAHAALETAIHERFAHLRERGEWFRVAPELLTYIEAVRAGQNPITLLW